MDLSGRPLVEICRRDQGLKLFLLRLEGFDACGQLLEFLLLFVGWLPLRSRRFLRRDRCRVRAGTGAAYGCWRCLRFGVAPLPEPVLISTDVLLDPPCTFEDER